MRIIFLLLPLSLSAQQHTLSGIIAVQNSAFDRGKIEYVQNAEIEEAAAKPRGHVTSDTDGRFKLVTVGIPEKEALFLRVNKPGLEVVNTGDLQAVAGQKEPLRLFMASTKYIVEAKRRYYNTGYTNAEKNLTQKIAQREQEYEALRRQANADKVKLNAMQSEIALLQAQYEKLDQLASELADKYARINLDDADTLFQSAFRNFQTGDFNAALKRWEQVGLLSLLEKEEARIKTLKISVAQRDSVKNRRKEDVMRNLNLKVDVHRLRFEWDSMYVGYEQLLRLDTANLDNNFAFGIFLLDQNNYSRARNIWSRAIKIARKPAEKAYSLHGMASLLGKTGALQEQEQLLTRSAQWYDSLMQTDPDHAQLGRFLVALDAASNLENQGKFAKAKGAYKHLSELLEAQEETLLKQKPAAVLAALNNLAMRESSAYRTPDQSIALLQRAIKHIVPLNKSNSFFSTQYQLALLYHNLGFLYLEVDSLDLGESFMLDALKIRRELYALNPSAMRSDLFTTLSNLGLLYRTQIKFEPSLSYDHSVLALLKSGKKSNEETSLDEYAESVLFYNLGLLHGSFALYDSSDYYLNKADQQFQSLTSDDPQRYGFNVIGCKAGLCENAIARMYQTGKYIWKVKGEQALSDAKKWMSHFENNKPARYKTYVDILDTYSRDLTSFDTISWYIEYKMLRPAHQKVGGLHTNEEKIGLYQPLVDSLWYWKERFPENKKFRRLWRESLTDLVELNLLEGRLQEAGDLLKPWLAGSTFSEEARSIEACIALLEGQWPKARTIYKRYGYDIDPKDDFVPAELFLEDLVYWQAIGIYHPLFEKAKQYLSANIKPGDITLQGHQRVTIDLMQDSTIEKSTVSDIANNMGEPAWYFIDILLNDIKSSTRSKFGGTVYLRAFDLSNHAKQPIRVTVSFDGGQYKNCEQLKESFQLADTYARSVTIPAKSDTEIAIVSNIIKDNKPYSCGGIRNYQYKTVYAQNKN